MNRVRIGKDGEQPGAYCEVCGRRLGDAYGPSQSGHYAVELGPSWYRDDKRVWHKGKYRRSQPRITTSGSKIINRGVQDIDTIACPCGERLAPP